MWKEFTELGFKNSVTVALDENKNRRKEEQWVMWEDVFAKQMKAFPLILWNVLIREKKWAAPDDQNNGWKKER